MNHNTKLAVFKINNEVIGKFDASSHSLFEIDNLKYMIAMERNVSIHEIEVEYKDEVIELATSFITPQGKLSIHNGLFNSSEINSIDFNSSINEQTEEGINTIIDFIHLKKQEEILVFKF